jgi:hypothetical protein
MIRSSNDENSNGDYAQMDIDNDPDQIRTNSPPGSH